MNRCYYDVKRGRSLCPSVNPLLRGLPFPTMARRIPPMVLSIDGVWGNYEEKST